MIQSIVQLVIHLFIHLLIHSLCLVIWFINSMKQMVRHGTYDNWCFCPRWILTSAEVFGDDVENQKGEEGDLDEVAQIQRLGW